MTNTQKPQRGRPPHESESATSRIVMRVTPHRKGSYVRAAKGEPLTEWAQRHLDKAADYAGNGPSLIHTRTNVYGPAVRRKIVADLSSHGEQ